MVLTYWRRVLATGLLFATTLGAHGATVSYTGTFRADDEQFVVGFDWSGLGSFAARTFSYGGGVNGNGMAIAAGGFAPVLALFDSAGLLLQNVSGSASACGSGVGASDPSTGYCWDAGFSALLVAGFYTLVLTQDGNTPNGPFRADGFAQSGRSNYTGIDYAGDDGRQFVNVDGSQRDGHWALDMTGQVSVAAVTEPIGTALFFTGLALVLLGRRGRRPPIEPTRA